MSSNGGASGIANVKQDFTFRGALMVIGIVCGFIIVLLILRYCCNIAIDLCIMCDPYEARRTTIEFRDKFFPCFKRRLVVPAVATERESSQTQTLDVETLLASLSDQDRRDVLGAVLTGKVVNKQDLIKYGQDSGREQKHDVESLSRSDSSNLSQNCDGGISCSICLLDLEIGSSVFVSPPCQHVFHRSCILEWCSGNNTLCPYCRAAMITEPQVRDAIINRTGSS